MAEERAVRAHRLVAPAAALVLAASPAGAQAPRPEPGFSFLFDGSAASFARWEFAGARGALGRATVDPALRAIVVHDSPFGAYWYPVRAFGDAVLRLQYAVEDTPGATANGGVVIRAPEVRYTGATAAAVLAQKPAGYSFAVCPGAIPACGRAMPAPSTTYAWRGASGPFPPPFRYTGAYCARGGTHNVAGLSGAPLRTNGNADDHAHWAQLACGHEIQINETPAGEGDPVKTGSVYGFRHLDARQSRTNERLARGVWHELEIRMVGQQYTVLVDGVLVNQFDNAVPRIASREGDAPTMARQLPRGYVGLQTHGGTDRIAYRAIRVRELRRERIPVNLRSPVVTRAGRALRCRRGSWRTAARTTFAFTWHRSNAIPLSHPRFRAPSPLDLAEAIVGRGPRYVPTRADAGKVLHCQVSATSDGATVWATRRAPALTRRR